MLTWVRMQPNPFDEFWLFDSNLVTATSRCKASRLKYYKIIKEIETHVNNSKETSCDLHQKQQKFPNFEWRFVDLQLSAFAILTLISSNNPLNARDAADNESLHKMPWSLDNIPRFFHSTNNYNIDNTKSVDQLKLKQRWQCRHIKQTKYHLLFFIFFINQNGK